MIDSLFKKTMLCLLVFIIIFEIIYSPKLSKVSAKKVSTNNKITAKKNEGKV